MPRFAIAAAVLLALAGCEHSASAPAASIGAGNPYPVTNYACEGGTRLAVRLMGDRASVSVNGAAPIELPVLGQAGTTYSNGRQTLTIVQGKVAWGLGRAVPSPCTEQ